MLQSLGVVALRQTETALRNRRPNPGPSHHPRQGDVGKAGVLAVADLEK